MKSSRILIETLIVLVVTLAGILFVPQAKAIFALLPIVFLLVERHLRKRSWAEIGFKFPSFWTDVRANLGWVLLVGVVLQVVVVLWATWFYPVFLEHVIGRLPATTSQLLILLPVLAVSLLGEELSFRSLFQDRLALFVGAPAGVVLSSLAFSVAHYSSGPMEVVLVDLGLIVVSSVIYGIIYARSRNVLVSWLAHFLADLVALILLVVLG